MIRSGENPMITEECQRQHNIEILDGPIDLLWPSGRVMFINPKLFEFKARTLLI